MGADEIATLARLVASITSREPADVRLQLARPLPWLVARAQDRELIDRIVEQLRAAGLGSVACAVSDAQPWTPPGSLTLAFEDTELVVCDGRLRVPYAAVVALVLASFDVGTTKETIEHVVVSRRPRQLPRTMPVSRYQNESQRERVAILVRGDGGPNLRIAQSTLRTPGITARTSFERFDHMVEQLQPRVPHAYVDDRLVDVRLPRTQFALGADLRTSTSSNAREVELVAHVIGRAWLEGQLDT